MHLSHDSILTLELPYRERLALRRTVFHGADGPKVAVLAGVHGGELEGLYVCHRLAAWIEALASAQPEAFLGQVELFPAMNPLGLDTLQRLVSVYETDLNRYFPGHAQGPLPQRIAEPAMRHLHEAALVIDIHASNIFLSGLFIPTVEHWINGHTDELLGRIVSPYGGNTLSEVRSPVDGILFTLSRFAIAPTSDHHPRRQHTWLEHPQTPLAFR
jgi:predicted deacylase